MCKFNKQKEFDYERGMIEYQRKKDFFEWGRKSRIDFMQQNLPMIKKCLDAIDEVREKESPRTAQDAQNNIDEIGLILNQLYSYFARFHI